MAGHVQAVLLVGLFKEVQRVLLLEVVDQLEVLETQSLTVSKLVNDCQLLMIQLEAVLLREDQLELLLQADLLVELLLALPALAK